MFDFAWTEIALIGVVALIAIGPKDLPMAIKAIAAAIKKMRRMAGEFQGHVDEMVREANLHEVRDQFNQLRSFDIKGEIAKAVDGDGSLRATLAENPLGTVSTWAADKPVGETLEPVAEAAPDAVTPDAVTPDAVTPDAEPPEVIADFSPPSFIPPMDLAAHVAPEPVPVPPAPPAFIPPGHTPPSATL